VPQRSLGFTQLLFRLKHQRKKRLSVMTISPEEDNCTSPANQLGCTDVPGLSVTRSKTSFLSKCPSLHCLAWLCRDGKWAWSDQRTGMKWLHSSSSSLTSGGWSDSWWRTTASTRPSLASPFSIPSSLHCPTTVCITQIKQMCFHIKHVAGRQRLRWFCVHCDQQLEGVAIYSGCCLSDQSDSNVCSNLRVSLSCSCCQMPLQHTMVDGATVLLAPTGMSNALAETLTISNYIFTGLFTMEMILKLFALGFFEYVADSFNIFDGLVVILSIVEIILDVSMLIQCSLCVPCPALLRPLLSSLLVLTAPSGLHLCLTHAQSFLLAFCCCTSFALVYRCCTYLQGSPLKSHHAAIFCSWSTKAKSVHCLTCFGLDFYSQVMRLIFISSSLLLAGLLTVLVALLTSLFACRYSMSPAKALQESGSSGLLEC